MRLKLRPGQYCLAMTTLAWILSGTYAKAQATQPKWEQERAAQIEAARREGIPTTLKELQHNKVPADQNAATYIEKIDELDKASPVSREDYEALDNLNRSGVTPDQIALGRKAFEAHRERFRLIHQVAQCSSYSETQKTLDIAGISLPDPFPENAKFRNYARWLVSESMLHLYDGKPFDAIQVDALTFRLARHVNSAGTIIGLLVADAIDSIALGGMRLILYREGQDAAVAEAVRKALETQRSAPDLGQAFRGEVVSYLVRSDAMRHEIPGMVKGDPGDKDKPPFEKTPEYRSWTKKYGYPTDPKRAMERNFHRNDAHYMAWMRRILPLVDLPYPEARSGITAITREADKSADHPDFALAALAIGVCAKLPAHKARQQAIAETVRVGAALLTWKAKHGHFPEKLEECLMPTPLDPFDLHPLRYRREGEGFVLYSIGESGKFDGGQPDKRPSPGESLFRYPLPVYAKQ